MSFESYRSWRQPAAHREYRDAFLLRVAESPLDFAQRAFDLLVHPPTTLQFDGCPDRLMSLYELKRYLLDRDTSREVRNLIWRELVVRSRKDGPGWGLGAVGLAMPGLRALAGGWRGVTVATAMISTRRFWGPSGTV
ncbi:hypothetical protein ACFYPG_23805 [Micromonospora sp. NPDC005553]|uniref:hypothetical protein n=1 Tax=Micromonospora sp. NPDC005553 TaxID=3364232 RepID=UPI00369471DB